MRFLHTFFFRNFKCKFWGFFFLKFYINYIKRVQASVSLIIAKTNFSLIFFLVQSRTHWFTWVCIISFSNCLDAYFSTQHCINNFIAISHSQAYSCRISSAWIYEYPNLLHTETNISAKLIKRLPLYSNRMYRMYDILSYVKRPPLIWNLKRPHVIRKQEMHERNELNSAVVWLRLSLPQDTNGFSKNVHFNKLYFIIEIHINICTHYD